MCRFLLAKSIKPSNLRQLFLDFTSMAHKSRTTDGDWQDDGWGIAWLEKNHWQTHHSLRPIWEENNFVNNIPQTNQLLIHARSASFAMHKGNINYNQPYTNNKLAYVFNGFISKIKLSQPVPGEIGAQKIFNLLQDFSRNNSVSASITKLHRLITGNSSSIKGFNLGVSDQNNIYAISDYNSHPDYFTQYYYSSIKLKLICSGKISHYRWKPLKKQTVIKL